MKNIRKVFSCLVITLFIALSFPTFSSAKWWRGQVHVHTNLTDPASAANWYKYHGYNFVMMGLGLNYPVPVEGVKSVVDAPGRFLVIPGIEVNSKDPRSLNKGNDTIGMGTNLIKDTKYKDPIKHMIKLPFEPPADTYNRAGRLIRDFGGVPAIAHPNFKWNCSAEDILKTDPKIIKHFEVYNSEPGMNDMGGGGRPSTEEIWDQVLSKGRVLYGVAGDDSHHFKDFGYQWNKALAVAKLTFKALPGRTSIYVNSKELTAKSIIDAIDRGDFYAVRHDLTMPIKFKSYKVDKSGIRIKLPAPIKDLGWTLPGLNPTRYSTYFIGKDGKVLKVDESLTPSYNFRGNELYVRARIQGSDGAIAWTQPVFVRKP